MNRNIRCITLQPAAFLRCVVCPRSTDACVEMIFSKAAKGCVNWNKIIPADKEKAKQCIIQGIMESKLPLSKKPVIQYKKTLKSYSYEKQ